MAQWFPFRPARRQSLAGYSPTGSSLTGSEKLSTPGRISRRIFWIAAGICLLLVMILALVLGLVLGLHHKAHAASPTSANPNDLTVDLGYSKYVGFNGDNSVNKWWGIRYAAAPTGNLRWRAPQDPPIDNQTYNADKHAPLCYASPSTSLNRNSSEDCLFLDVYAPNDNGSHPVFVFIQGGGFNQLSNPNLDGSNLIVAGDHDIVVVTFNYRVGLYGFLTSQEVQADGDLNVGLLDQRQVLQWVQKYIHLFGGDPNHVTIGGDSAGGASVDLHLSAYGGRDDGLFHAAAAESQSFGPQLTVKGAQYQYDGLLKRVKCDSSTDTLSCLRNTTVEVLAKNNINMPNPNGVGGGPIFMYSNVIDGNFTRNLTYRAFAAGEFIKIPTIFGDDTNEGTIFTPSNIENYTDVNNFLNDNFPKMNSTQMDQIDKYYPMAEQFPKKGAYWRTAANAFGEIRYICPGLFINSMMSNHGVNTTWNYHWDFLTPKNAANGLGVTHTEELGSIWGTSSAPESVMIPTIQNYWVSFIRSKDPNTYKLATAPSWEPFTASGMNRVYLGNDPSNVTMEVVSADQQERCRWLWGQGPSLGQ